jgi:hypothetical protein
MSKQPSVGLMARGDIVSFVMTDGSVVELPKSFVLLHDPSGKLIDKCTLVCCRCSLQSRLVHTIPSRIHDYVVDYFGSDAVLVKGTVEIPKGPWHPLGTVKEIRYDRHGQYEDAFYHPFSDSDPGVELFRQGKGSAYLLVLPGGCKVDARGFVWP